MTEDAQQAARAFTRLLKVVSTLRGEHGCPWDRKQTPESLKKYLVEECRELADAIESGRPEDIREETGDVFFILTLLSTMFAEKGFFSHADVLDQITEKMIRRHPHVFSGGAKIPEDELRLQWERIKAEEKQDSPPSRR